MPSRATGSKIATAPLDGPGETCMRMLMCMSLVNRLAQVPLTEIDRMAPKHRKRPVAPKARLRRASGAYRGDRADPPSPTAASRRSNGLRALCGTRNTLEEFIASHDECTLRCAAKALNTFAIVHFVRCCSWLSAVDTSRVASAADIAKVRTVSITEDWGEAGFGLCVLLLEFYARHENNVTSAFVEGRCSLQRVQSHISSANQVLRSYREKPRC